METNKTDKEILSKGLKMMLLTLALLFLSPTLIYIAFNNQEKPLYIPLLIIGIIGAILAIYFGFKGIHTILDSMFKKNN